MRKYEKSHFTVSFKAIRVTGCEGPLLQLFHEDLSFRVSDYDDFLFSLDPSKTHR
jgi:hypothetical protein